MSGRRWKFRSFGFPAAVDDAAPPISLPSTSKVGVKEGLLHPQNGADFDKFYVLPFDVCGRVVSGYTDIRLSIAFTYFPVR